MTDPTTPTAAARWRFALALFVAALGVLIATLAPTVILWDAGEFLAASRILGVPHPPGTPLWVMLAHSWGTIVAVGTWAWRINLMTAVASAAATACFGLMAWEALRRVPAIKEGGLPAWFVPLGAAGAALAGCFTFTNWQNSNESEVYALAVFVIAFSGWLLHRWREARGTPAADRLLLVIIYLAGLSIGNHLLALLAGPAVVAFLFLVSREAPLKDAGDRSRENATTAVVAGTWLLMIGLGLGNKWISIAGAACFVIAAIWAFTHGRGAFASVAVVVSLIGLTSYLFLYLRSGQHPILNEAQPDTWNSLLSVIRREQYGIRTPFDDPTVVHGPMNPGRSLLIIGLQLVNYFQYFSWQWGVGATDWRLIAPFASAFTLLGVLGAAAHRRADRAGWGMFLVLFLTTGLGLMAYMNFKPGFSIGYEWFPNFQQHEVRERDYFFVVSFIVWGIWAGMGLVLLARQAWSAVAAALRPLVAGGVIALCLLPIATNWLNASRARPPMAQLARDFAYDVLNSVPPYGILITFGDNDTFPLWYAQEVEGIRPDVTMVCLALAQTDWYLKQLRDNPTRLFVDSAAAPVWRGQAGPRPDRPLHSMTDQEIDGFIGRLHEIAQNTPVQLGPIAHVIPAGAVLAPNDIGVLRIIQANLGYRPIAWSISTGRNFLGLDPYIVQTGLGYSLRPTLPDSTDRRYASRGMNGVLLDVPATTLLVDSVYRWSGLAEIPERAPLEGAAEGVTGNLSQAPLLLAVAADARGDAATALKYLELAYRIRPDPSLKAAADQLRMRVLQSQTPAIPRP
jgi:transmembrane protein TMEM260 (protein O-mannosyltransferase)